MSLSVKSMASCGYTSSQCVSKQAGKEDLREGVRLLLTPATPRFSMVGIL